MNQSMVVEMTGRTSTAANRLRGELGDPTGIRPLVYRLVNGARGGGFDVYKIAASSGEATRHPNRTRLADQAKFPLQETIQTPSPSLLERGYRATNFITENISSITSMFEKYGCRLSPIAPPTLEVAAAKTPPKIVTPKVKEQSQSWPNSITWSASRTPKETFIMERLVASSPRSQTSWVRPSTCTAAASRGTTTSSSQVLLPPFQGYDNSQQMLKHRNNRNIC